MSRFRELAAPFGALSVTGAQIALKKVIKHHKNQTVKAIYADKGYSGVNFAGWVKTKLNAVVKVGANLTTSNQFIPAKKRWVAERTFAWFGDNYRLSIDRERSSRNSVTFIRLAFIRLLLRRLWPS